MKAYMVWHKALIDAPERLHWSRWIDVAFGRHTDHVIQTICRSPPNYTPRELADWRIYAIILQRQS